MYKKFQNGASPATGNEGGFNFWELLGGIIGGVGQSGVFNQTGGGGGKYEPAYIPGATPTSYNTNPQQSNLTTTILLIAGTIILLKVLDV